MVLRLDPRVPAVWRSPTSLQFGFDTSHAVLTDVTPGEDRLVAALRRGVSRQSLALIGQAVGTDAAAVERLLVGLAPVILESVEPAPVRWTIAVDGDDAASAHVAMLLGEEGHRVRRGGAGAVQTRCAPGDADAGTPRDGEDEDRAEPIDLAILTGQFAIAPDRYGAWLRRDVPHLPLVFGDAAVRIGPLVEPGEGPCLYCLDRTRTDEDPAWPALAAQLMDRTAPTATPLLRAEAALRTVRAALARLESGSRRLSTSSLRLHPDGTVAFDRHLRHPDCGCRVLPGNVTALADGRAARSATTSGSTASVPG